MLFGGNAVPQCAIDNNCTISNTPCKVMSLTGIFDSSWEGAPWNDDPVDISTGVFTQLYVLTDRGTENIYRCYNYSSTISYPTSNCLPQWEAPHKAQQMKSDVGFGLGALYYWDGDSWVNTSGFPTVRFWQWYPPASAMVVGSAVYGALTAIISEDWYIADIDVAASLPPNPDYGCGSQFSWGGTNIWNSDAGNFTSGTYSWTTYGDNSIDNDPAVGGGSLHFTYGTGTYNAGTVELSDAADLDADLEVGEWYRLIFRLRLSPANANIYANISGGSGGNVRGPDMQERYDTVGGWNNLNYVVLEFQAESAAGDALQLLQANAGAGTWGEMWIDEIELRKINP